MRYLVGLLLLPSAFAGCGGGDGEDVDTSTPSSQTASTSPGISPQVTASSRRVGQVGVPGSEGGGQAVVGDVKVGGEPAFESKPIFEESQIATGDNSSVEFTLDGPIRCDTGENSLLDIWPRVEDSSEQLVIRWDPRARDSSSFCSKSGPVMGFGIGDRIKLVMGDPIFGIVISEGNVTVKLVEGSATVTVEETDFVLTDQKALFVPPVGTVGKFDLVLTEEELAIVARLKGVPPEDVFPRPNLTARYERYNIDLEMCEIWYTVTNAGAAAAGESLTYIKLNGKSMEQSAPALAPRESKTLTAIFDGSCTPVLQGLITVDTDNRIDESNEDDNSVEILEQPPPIS